jgi:hypothetical protein
MDTLKEIRMTTELLAESFNVSFGRGTAACTSYGVRDDVCGPV